MRVGRDGGMPGLDGQARVKTVALGRSSHRSAAPAFNRRQPSRVAEVSSLAADKPEATAGRMPFWQ